MDLSDRYIWGVIVAVGVGSYLLRFSFLGLIGGRQLPPELLRHLRFAAVAILPGLVAPLVLWPAATGGHPDAPRLIAAAVAVAAGIGSRNFIVALFAGAAALYLGLWLV